MHIYNICMYIYIYIYISGIQKYSDISSPIFASKFWWADIGDSTASTAGYLGRIRRPPLKKNNVGPPSYVCWFLNASKYSYKYHKP